jgi:hypothetical protein
VVIPPLLRARRASYPYRPPVGGKECDVVRAAVAALAAICLLAVGGRVLSAGDQAPGDKLPEPAIQFAKETTIRLTETEREWAKVAERLARCQADFSVAGGSDSDASLRDEAGRLLASAKKLLADQRQMGDDLDRFKDTLKKASAHYQAVAALYKAHASKARSEEVKEDYLQLAKAYERKAATAAGRGRKAAMPSGVAARAELVEEGNLFLERLVEAVAIGSVSDTEREVFAGRLKKHGERCKALAEELRRGVEKLLLDSDTPEIRRAMDDAARVKSPTPRAPEGSGAKREPGSLDGASWSSPVTVAGARCVTVIRFDRAGNCSQTTYLLGANGKGKPVATASGTFNLDAGGILSFYQGGVLVEKGLVTFRGKDHWSYEVLVNLLAPGIAGTRLAFTREP